LKGDKPIENVAKAKGSNTTNQFFLVKGLCQSLHDGTRKILNYAWTEPSQEKFWWRFEAVLTCKSFVWF